YTSYIPYIVQHGISTPDLLDELVSQQDRCLDDIRLHDRISQNRCEDLVQTILQHSVTTDLSPMCTNQYDIRLVDEYPSCGLLWPNELPQMKEYLTRNDVKAALHANGAILPWTECSTRVSSALRFDDSMPAISLLPAILDRVNVLLFSGDKDLICNHIGTEYLISNMTWQDTKGFQDAPAIPWMVDNEPAGLWRQDKNLTYVLLYNASHMVPYDAPLAALDMMNRFMGLDPRMQTFTSHLDTDTSENQNLPPGGEKVDIGQPKRSFFSANVAAVLLLVMIAVGIGIFVVVRKNQQQKKLGDAHDGIQWFPLSNSRSSVRGREPVHTDELDELVIESAIHDSEDEYHDDDDERTFGSQDRRV
ncbi:Cell death protease, partial [Gamsiella multidivaricata]